MGSQPLRGVKRAGRERCAGSAMQLASFAETSRLRRVASSGHGAGEGRGPRRRLAAAGCSLRYYRASPKHCGAVTRSVIAAKRCLVFYGMRSLSDQKSNG